jgi:hypothetical protein
MISHEMIFEQQPASRKMGYKIVYSNLPVDCFALTLTLIVVAVRVLSQFITVGSIHIST